MIAWRNGALGDFVLTLPALDRLAEEGPLTVIAPARYAALFPRAAEWIDADGPVATGIFAGRVRLDHDVGVAWTAGAADALARAGVREVLAGRPHPPPGVHAADSLWEPLRARWGPRDRDPRVAGASLAAHAGAVVLSPGSGGTRKRWPLTRWRAVADAIAGCLWVGGPVEAGEPGWGSPRRDDLDLAGLVGLATVARAWLGPDSGPLHLAAAAGCRVGAVFVDTDPACWAPIGGRVFSADTTPDALTAWATGG